MSKNTKIDTMEGAYTYDDVMAMESLDTIERACEVGAMVEKGVCDMCGTVADRCVQFNMHDGSPMAVCESCSIAHNRRVFG